MNRHAKFVPLRVKQAASGLLPLSTQARQLADATPLLNLARASRQLRRCQSAAVPQRLCSLCYVSEQRRLSSSTQHGAPSKATAGEQKETCTPATSVNASGGGDAGDPSVDRVSTAPPPVAKPNVTASRQGSAASTQDKVDDEVAVEDMKQNRASAADHDEASDAIPEVGADSDFGIAEDLELDDEEEDAGDNDAGTTEPVGVAPSKDKRTRSAKEIKKEKERQLRDAKASLQYERLLSSSNYHKYVHVTEVSTPSGVRWIDACARPALWTNRLLAKQPEAEFAGSVLEAICGSLVGRGMYTAITSSGALPSVVMEENWMCLTLRTSKQRILGIDPYSSALAIAALTKAESSGEWEGNDVLHHSASTESDSGLRRDGEQETFSEKMKRVRLAEKQYEESHTQSASAKGTSSKAKNAGAVEFSRKHVHEASTSRLGIMDPSMFLYYDEELDELTPLDDGNTSTLSHWRQRQRRLRAYRRAQQRGSMSQLRQKLTSRLRVTAKAERPRRVKSPTIAEETERVSIILLKEMHPCDAEGCHKPLTTSAMTKATKLGELQEDEEGNTVFTTTWKAERALRKEREARTAGVSDAAPNSDADPSPHDPDDAAVADASELRWVVITVHREPVTFVQETILRWQEFLANGGRLRNEEGNLSSSVFFDYSKTVGWEEIVRHLFYESVRGLHTSSLGQTHALDDLESGIFGNETNSAEQIRRMRSILAELHVFSRRSSIQANIFKESKVAYCKLKKVINSPMTPADRSSLLFLDSAASLAGILEEQADSLLFLQFSVAMSQMENLLRTLTLFSTFFTPLQFIISCFTVNFTNMVTFKHGDNSIMIVFSILGAVAAVTYRWITRSIG